MNRLFSLLVIVLLLTASNSALSIEREKIQSSFGFELNIESSVLKEKRKILIHLPDGYEDSNKQYSVLYLLDGNRHFKHAVMASKVLVEDERIPELIIVGITNNSGTRGRDLGRMRDRFFKFIESEVVTYIDENYRSSKMRTLFGHSMAGYFSMRLLSEESDLFDNYIAASPVLQNGGHVVYKNFSVDGKTLNKNLYFTLAGQAQEGRRTTSSVNQVVGLLKEDKIKALNWKYELKSHLTHMTTPYPTLYEGLNFVFNSFQAPSFATKTDYENSGGMSSVIKHYQKRAQLYNTANRVPEQTLRSIANLLLEEGDKKGALKIYLDLVESHPKSAATHSGLGEVYKEMNLLDKSIESHKQAVKHSRELSPGWQRFLKRRLDNVLDLKNQK